MAPPELIPIAHEPEYRTSTIGRYADGLFMGGVVAGWRPGKETGWRWAKHKRWYAYVHRFGADGRHRGSTAEFIGTTADGEGRVLQAADRRLAEMLDALPGKKLGDIAVGLFRVEIDGVEFGLIDESDEEGDHVELHPDELGFYPPWDGLYDT